MKLTKAQQEALEWGSGVISVGRSTHRVWATNAQGMSINIRRSVFDALMVAKLIARSPELSTVHTNKYTRKATLDELRKPVDEVRE